eukprot:GHVU01151719.1.p1 GENE.GHVU01151719.1~~GHVU01151719.1.p1  ORF type:complete len:410 (+),score=60.17 GHVU01151719.1:22-1230(+)
MAEIVALPWCGLTCASTFAGAGGSSLGWRMAGFRVLYANEFVPIAQESYKANAAPYTVVDGRDVKKVTPEDVLRACNLAAGELDVLDGSPPCQAFSTSGRREKGWGTDREYEHGDAQRNEEMFDEFTRLRDGISPRAFVAENVSGLVKGVAKGWFLRILRDLKRGYRVKVALLDAQWLGVPQARQRVVFVGVRDDLNADPAFPAPLPYNYSIRDALPWITRVTHDTSGAYSTGVVTDRLSPTITCGGLLPNACHFKVEAEADISRFAIGAEYDRLNPGQQSDRYFNLVRADADAPSPTIMSSSANYASAACVVHPTEKRKFSIAELKRLCGFPDDFVLTGTYGSQWERLGNSVPPIMMKFIAEVVRDQILLPWKAEQRQATKLNAGKPDRRKVLVSRRRKGP